MFFALAVASLAAFLAGICILSVMAARIDNAQRFASLVERTRELRASRRRGPLPPRVRGR